MATSDQAVGDEQPSLRRVTGSTWASLEHRTRKKIALSGVFAALLALLDVVAVGLLPTLVERFEGKSGEYLTGLSTPALGGVIVALLVFKSMCGAGLLYWQSAFMAHDEGERTIGLFRHLLERPYGETSGVNTAAFVRDLHVALPQLYRGSAAGMALLITDGLGLVSLGAIVVISRPLTGLSLLLLFVFAGWLYNVLIRARVARLSVRMYDSNRECLNDLNESFGGLKTLKAFRAEDMAARRFTKSRREFALTARDFMVYSNINRYYLEIALVVALGGSLGATYAADGRGAVLAAFGLLTGVAARAMPALSRALTSVTVIKISGASVLALEPDLRRLEEATAVERPDPRHLRESAQSGDADGRHGPLVSFESVSFRYPTAVSDAVRDVSLELHPGEMVAVLGESGAGKTTLVDVMIGLLSPQTGTVQRPVTASIGYVAQETFVWDDTVRFNVSLDRPAAGGDVESEIWASLEAARVADWVRALPRGLDARLGERGGLMSGGQRQRLGLARALYGHPTILVLDEPTSALDSETSRSLLSTLVTVKASVGIIVVTHDPIVLEYSDRTITLSPTAHRSTA